MDREAFVYYTPQQQAFKETGVLPKDHLWVNEFVFFIRDIHKEALTFVSYEQVREAGYKVAIIEGNSYVDEFFAANLDTYTYSSARDSFTALLNGEVDVYIVDRVTGLATIQEMGIGNEISFIPKVIAIKPMLMPFSKKSDYPNIENIMVDYYAQLANMRDNGEYQKIYQKYIQN